ncbi:hypothetical protein RV15_GL001064 [Enterococcus silesiacus]|uniref:Uncharacterized protein n=1 Tax=Enterococcus silesiacus TaxID=332949 RepID=A0AA91GGG2_9ENTE|nr:hypothetical protein RV15_GL001064 [Enterococcus silesiacus]
MNEAKSATVIFSYFPVVVDQAFSVFVLPSFAKQFPQQLDKSSERPKTSLR